MGTRSVLAALLVVAAWGFAQGDEKLRNALGDQKYEDGWIYDDLDAGFAAARKAGKPVLICFSCVP